MSDDAGRALTGHCMCGAVSFEVAGQLGPAGYCHCTRCQRRSGSAAGAAVVVPPDTASVRVVAGSEHIRTWQPGSGNPKCFCGICGGGLWSIRRGTDHIAAVRLGTLDPGHGIRPVVHTRTATAADWERIPDDGLPRFADMP